MRAFLPALALLLACGPAAAAPQELNVVLVSLNALRADHLAAYGYGAETAPNISSLAEGGTVFEQAVAQSNWTLPSLASLFTSRYPRGHGVYERGQELPEKAVTLAEALKAGGWRTAAFTGGLDTAGVYGLARGFDVYYDETGDKPMGSFKELLPRALDWLAANRSGRFFLFLDSYDVHPPFNKPWPGGQAPAYSGPLKDKTLNYELLNGFGGGTRRLAPGDLAYVRARYDAGIAYADGFVGRLLRGLDELGLSTGTVVILTSEHGEELGERGTFDRAGRGNLYEETVRVPLIIRHPAWAAGARVRTQAQLIDLMPTVLDLLGLPAPAGAQGASLLPAAAGTPGKDFNSFTCAEAGPGKSMLRSPGWKLIRDAGKYRLFDLAKDPGETSDLAAARPEVVYALAQELVKRAKAAGAGSPQDGRRITLSPEMKRKLREAGYWR